MQVLSLHSVLDENLIWRKALYLDDLLKSLHVLVYVHLFIIEQLGGQQWHLHIVEVTDAPLCWLVGKHVRQCLSYLSLYIDGFKLLDEIRQPGGLSIRLVCDVPRLLRVLSDLLHPLQVLLVVCLVLL